MHVVDATLFYSPTSGGVKRYLLAKHEWMHEHTNWRHSLVVPGDHDAHVPDDVSMVSGGRVPGAFNYRLPIVQRENGDTGNHVNFFQPGQINFE